MKVLVVGQGGREHALLWKIRQSESVTKLYSAPGNGGTDSIAENVPIKADDIEGLKSFCKKEKIDLTLVGPEAPLALGIADIFKKEGLRIFGPTKQAAQLEASKIFTKELCRNENIPTADFEIFSSAERAKDYVKSKGAPIVVKADGLAAGKGVYVAKTEQEANEAIDQIMLERAFGASGDRVIVETCLQGEEASIIVLSDGEHVVPLVASQDHKRIFDEDRGPNTGGMGAYSPAPVVTENVFNETLSRIIKPTIAGMKKRGLPHTGVLYAGIMITDGGPELLEFNVRFGDPETQAILPRLRSDFVSLLEATIDGRLADYSLEWDPRDCVCVVLTSGGYPGKYEKGKEIRGLENVSEMDDTMVFHAGTKRAKGDTTHMLLTDGGRVLNVVALGKGIRNAIDKAYRACSMISFDGMHYRKDIGHRALGRTVSTQ